MTQPYDILTEAWAVVSAGERFDYLVIPLDDVVLDSDGRPATLAVRMSGAPFCRSLGEVARLWHEAAAHWARRAAWHPDDGCHVHWLRIATALTDEAKTLEAIAEQGGVLDGLVSDPGGMTDDYGAPLGHRLRISFP